MLSKDELVVVNPANCSGVICWDVPSENLALVIVWGIDCNKEKGKWGCS